MESEPRRLLSIRINGMVLLGALVVQYALGMYVNLYVAFPKNATEEQLWEFAWSQTPLAAHILLAILLLLGAIVLCIRAILLKNRTWIITSAIGLLGILAAGGSGAIFIPSQSNAYSYSMSLAFLVAASAYTWALFSSNATSKEGETLP